MSRDPDTPIARHWSAMIEQAGHELPGIVDRLDDDERSALRAVAHSLIRAVDDYAGNQADLLDRCQRRGERSD